MFSVPLLSLGLAMALIAPAAAQIAPNDSGRGIQRGLTAMNSSAQVGSLTVLRGAGNPVIVLNVHGAPAGRPETATISRGADCRASDHTTGIVLGAVVNGRLRATSPLTFDRLMSGNYHVVVHNNTAASRAVLCGQLYVN